MRNALGLHVVQSALSVPGEPALPEGTFVDDFNRASLGDAWSIQSGTWEIHDDALRCTTQNGIIFFGTDLAADHYIEADILDSRAELLVRASSTSAYYLGLIIGTDWYIYRVLAAVVSQAVGTATRPVRVRLETDGTTLRLFEWSGSEWVARGSGSNDVHTGGLKVGFRIGTTTSAKLYDNFKCGPLT